MADVFKIADFLISMSNESEVGDCITNMRLNKLLYFAQGQYLAKTGCPLFDKDLEAWKYGPVVPEIYNKYKKYGKNCITETENLYGDLSDDIILFLIDIMREYGKYSTSYLVSESHKSNAPWLEAYRSGKPLDTTEMLVYFADSSRKLKSFSDVIASKNLPSVGYRDKDGYLVLPKDLDD